MLKKVYFRSFLHKAPVIPDGLRPVDRADGELHPGNKKITLSFFLPRGSHGTMLIKRLSLLT